MRLAAALYKNDKLKSLYLEENEIGAEGGAALQVALRETRCVDRIPQPLQLAFAMGLHPRLGQRCWLFALDKFIFWRVLAFWRTDRDLPHHIATSEREPPHSLYFD